MSHDGSSRWGRVRIHRFATLILGVVLLAGCAAPQVPQTAEEPETEPVRITVSAAMTLKRVFERLAAEYESETGTKVVLNFGASGVLQKQIEGGSQVDVFASAAPKQMDALVAGGFVSVDSTRTFASNDIVVLTRAGEERRLPDAKALVDLERIATGNPESTPIGAAAEQWMSAQGLADEFASRVVYGENVTQVMEYLTRGEVDAVVVFGSEVVGRDDVTVAFTVPSAEAPPIRYVIAPLAGSTHLPEAEGFVELVLSERGRAALSEAGFVLLETAP